ncbi:hypothetical protein BJY00DRAFT_315801 [Aspergillus carlsbadensis]|nr:hypothetical protein BJY00DRAFT_315801 [Aspergillus carlsbadensis]
MNTSNGDTFKLIFQENLLDQLENYTGPEATNSYGHGPNTGDPLELKGTFSTRSCQHFPSGLLRTEEIKIGNNISFSSASRYSMAGKLQEYKDPHGQSYQHEYDAASQLSSLNLADLNLSCSYDAASRLSGTSIQDKTGNASLVSAVTYDDFGRQASLRRVIWRMAMAEPYDRSPLLLMPTVA